MNYKENQFVQLPTRESKENSDLIPEEEYVYLGLKSFYNESDKKCNPSYEKLSERLKIKSTKTIKKYIDSLENKGYIKIIRGKYKTSNQYFFIKELDGFEKFSYAFFENNILNSSLKAFVAAIQRLMYINQDTGIGNITFQPLEISKKLNVSLSITNKRMKDLEKLGVMEIYKTNTRDLQTGLLKNLYQFNLTKYNPIIKVLINHEERIQENTNDIAELKERMNILEEENKKYRKRYGVLI
jgi:DNA-binding MarR family transcriptional regulator